MKVIQIVVVKIAPDVESLYALCDNGRIARKDIIYGPGKEWVPVPEVPDSLFR